jgi:uncharacterized protein (DUF1800 family)
MLFYLDNYISKSPLYNENWAREMFELHTLGAENYFGVIPQVSVPGYPADPAGYCDKDVYEAAAGFTGWRVNDDDDLGNTGQYYFDASWHERGLKRVLGADLDHDINQGELDGKVILDRVAKHPGAGRFILRKLWRRFIGENAPRPYKGPPDDPSPAPGVDPAHDFLEECAALWTSLWQDPQQIRKVIEKLLTDPKSPFKTTWATKIKRPFEASVSMLRALGADFRPTREREEFFWYYDALGQGLWSRRPPDGYPDRKEAWSSTVSMLMRWRLCNWIIEEGGPLDREDIKVDLVATTLAAFPDPNTRTPNAVADYWINRILGRAMVAATNARQEVVQMLARGSNAATYRLTQKDLEERLHEAAALILMSPDFQWR